MDYGKSSPRHMDLSNAPPLPSHAERAYNISAFPKNKLPGKVVHKDSADTLCRFDSSDWLGMGSGELCSDERLPVC